MKYILCQPAIKRFEWELEVCITRLKKLGINDIVLLFAQWDSAIPKYFEETYEVEVHVYSDADREKAYIPSVKPYLWMKYLEEDPSRENNVYFYIDSDVLFREIPKLIPTKDTWYASDCSGYIGLDYIDSKGQGLLDRMCNVIGIDPALIRKHRPMGGAQWIIKKPTHEYWKKVYEDSVALYDFLCKVEAEYIRDNGPEYTPIQKWTAEMWAQLWNVYHFGKSVKVDSELEFCWPNDSISRYQETKILHNAGVTDDRKGLFFKGQYVERSPLKEGFSYVNKSKASYEYVKAIQDVSIEVNKLTKYRVIESFADLQDKNKAYQAGEVYPRPTNKKIPEKRIEELSTNKNAAGRPFIEEVSEEEGE
jgi:hypothetical protein